MNEFPDCVDDYHRNHHDCHGTGKHLRRKKRGQVPQDSRAFLNAVDEKYDVIMVDAYQDITIPFRMSSTEFFTLVKEHLTENGVMVVNMNMRVIDQLIQDEVAYYKGIYEKEGIGGLLNSL